MILITTTISKEAIHNIHIVNGVAEAFKKINGEDATKFCYIDDIHSNLMFNKITALIILGSGLREGIDLISIAYFARINNIKTIFWCTDDPYEISNNIAISNLFDIFLTNDMESRRYYSNPNLGFLPLGGSIENDLREVSNDFLHEIFFAGYPYANRKLIIKELVNVLSDHDIQITLSKGKWDLDNSSNIKYLNFTNHSELIDSYNKSRCILNLGRTYNLANKNGIIASTPGPRTFETALACSPQIYFGNSTELDNYFSNKAIFKINNVKDVPKIYNDLLDFNYRSSFAKLAQKQALENHLYENRARSILNFLSMT